MSQHPKSRSSTNRRLGFAELGALPFMFLAFVVIASVGGRLTTGTSWGIGGSNFYAGRAVEVVASVIIGFAAFVLRRRTLQAFPTEVWFSTKEQFDAFDNAVNQASWLRKSARTLSDSGWCGLYDLLRPLEDEPADPHAGIWTHQDRLRTDRFCGTKSSRSLGQAP